MKKVLLLVLILLDIVIMASAAFFLYMHMTKHSNGSMVRMLTSAPAPLMNQPANPGVAIPRSGSLIVASSSTAVIASSQPPMEGGMRKILFSYRNPKAKEVFIRADFTGWKADAMHKDAKGMWIYQANLLPGEYAYCFTVDDKTFRDPANKRTKQIGRTYVSAIIVKPPSPPPQ